MARSVQTLISSSGTASASAKVQASHIYKQFENKRQGGAIDVLDDVSLSIGSGEFLSIVGPRCCGKTTLLRIFAGLIPPTSGSVFYDGDEVTEPSSKMGFVFQSDNLMPWR